MISTFWALHPPSEIFTEISKNHIQIFRNVFDKSPHYKKIKQIIVDQCVDWTRQHKEFNWWFDENSECCNHHKIILDFL